jgi:DNA (cytosine-5)-methyltransferase 1
LHRGDIAANLDLSCGTILSKLVYLTATVQTHAGELHSMTPKVIAGKLRRLGTGVAPRLLDLFSGCGGLSLGFHTLGFQIVGAVESDPVAIKSHARNFHGHLPESQRRIYEKSVDIANTSPRELFMQYGCTRAIDEQVDVIVGGPPCQAFSRVGRPKLREIAKHPEAFLRDPRSNLYLRYIQYVKELKPLALLMENVPDVLNFGGHNIAEEICEVLVDEGYEARYTTLNAVFYGVPQMRERMFLIAYRREIEPNVWFPNPDCEFDLPVGYHGTRQVALKTINQNLFSTTQYYQKPPLSEVGSVRKAVSARDALSDLPWITMHLKGLMKRGARRFDKLIRYNARSRLSDYQQEMRTWPGFEAGDGLYDHVIRYLPRDYDIFRRMRPGDQYPQAKKIANELFEEKLKAVERNTGKRPRRGSNAYKELEKATVPPYSDEKFPNKWRKMEADLPARTLMAHLGKDSYSHIHYASNQARTISVREAARLQSFPDGFVFEGSMNHAFRQIGNAVPPLMAKAFATVMLRQLCSRRHEMEKNGRNKAACI